MFDSAQIAFVWCKVTELNYCNFKVSESSVIWLALSRAWANESQSHPKKKNKVYRLIPSFPAEHQPVRLSNVIKLFIDFDIVVFCENSPGCDSNTVNTSNPILRVVKGPSLQLFKATATSPGSCLCQPYMPPLTKASCPRVPPPCVYLLWNAAVLSTAQGFSHNQPQWSLQPCKHWGPVSIPQSTMNSKTWATFLWRFFIFP